MTYTYPHSIENFFGEKLIFNKREEQPDGDILHVENYVSPGQGPIMHTHFLQDECLTVVEGSMAYQIKNQPVRYVEAGESILFEKGVPHKFWNCGNDTLHCKGWIKPANTIEFFLGAVFAAQNKSRTHEPEKFDGAFLMTRYSCEYDIVGIPVFVKKVIMPITYFIGKLLGKYKHFENAPEPVRTKLS